MEQHLLTQLQANMVSQDKGLATTITKTTSNHRCQTWTAWPNQSNAKWQQRPSQWRMKMKAGVELEIFLIENDDVIYELISPLFSKN